MSNIQRAVVIVLDSCGAGEAPDAADYGDTGSDTLGHTAEAVGGLTLPNFQAAGLGNLHPDLLGVPPAANPSMAYRKTQGGLRRQGFDHRALGTGRNRHRHPDGRRSPTPDSRTALVRRSSKRADTASSATIAASGTVIIENLGPQNTSKPVTLILYTSADSVFQIAAHKDIVPLEELYRVCEIARRHCNEYHIGRVIARPFEGELGSFYRTYERHDYAMPPHSPTLLDHASAAGLPVLGIGKIEDLFAGRGLTAAVHTEGDADGLEKTLEALDEYHRGIIFVNLVDLDMRYGHRENPEGYAAGLALIDSYLPALIAKLTDRTCCSSAPTTGTTPPTGAPTTPVSTCRSWFMAGPRLVLISGIRNQYCDVAATIAEALDLTLPVPGGFLPWGGHMTTVGCQNENMTLVRLPKVRTWSA